MKAEIDFDDAMEVVYRRLNEFVSNGYEMSDLVNVYCILNTMFDELKKESKDEKD